jgi:hypothetical protein
MGSGDNVANSSCRSIQGRVTNSKNVIFFDSTYLNVQNEEILKGQCHEIFLLLFSWMDRSRSDEWRLMVLKNLKAA